MFCALCALSILLNERDQKCNYLAFWQIYSSFLKVLSLPVFSPHRFPNGWFNRKWFLHSDNEISIQVLNLHLQWCDYQRRGADGCDGFISACVFLCVTSLPLLPSAQRWLIGLTVSRWCVQCYTLLCYEGSNFHSTESTGRIRLWTELWGPNWTSRDVLCRTQHCVSLLKNIFYSTEALAVHLF